MARNDARMLSRQELLEKRRQVIRLYKKATPVMKIVEACGLSWPAVNKAIKLYETGGIKALEPAQRGRKQGTGRALSEEQENELRRILYRKRPWQAGIKRAHGRLDLWNRDAVGQLIHQHCGSPLSVRGVAKYLERWGFPLMKPNQRPVKRCTREIQGWLKRHQERLEKLQKTKNAEVYYVSRRIFTIPRNNTSGQENNWPRKLSMISAIDNHGKEHWIIVKGNYTQEKQIKFLKTLVSQSRNKIILIRNNPDHYTDRDVADWIAKNKHKIESFPLLLPKEIKKKQDAQRRALELQEELKARREQKDTERRLALIIKIGKF